VILSEWDEENPPKQTHSTEADRLLFRGLIRLAETVVLLWLAGVGIMDQGILKLPTYQPWWLAASAAILYIRAFWPMLRSIEHFWVDIKQTWRRSRFSNLAEGRGSE